MGRLGSYAGLLHAGNTVDPARTKFYGDVQERLTAASTHLLFFSLELNRIDDALFETAMRDPALGHYRPWLEDVRRYRPYQLEDRVEQLFHEKSMTAYSAWNRQFDATIANLRFKVAGKSLAIEPTLNLLQDRSGEKRKAAAQALAHTFKDHVAAIRAHHQHARQGQGNLRPLARFCRHRRRPPSCPTGSSAKWSMRWWPPCAPPIRGCRTAIMRSRRRWFGKKRLPHWDRNAPLPQVPTRTVGWIEARNTVLTAYGAFSPKMAAIAERFFNDKLDRRAGSPGQGAGRIRASDRAVGASLCAAQLSGQAARRDDARARIGSRRASGPGGAERRTDGADAADACRNRERVRRNADFQEAPGRHDATRKSARRCSPPRSRT